MMDAGRSETVEEMLLGRDSLLKEFEALESLVAAREAAARETAAAAAVIPFYYLLGEDP